MNVVSWSGAEATAPAVRAKRGQPLQPPRKLLVQAAGYAASGKGQEGGLVALMGASGSGKSTLLNALAGRTTLDAGELMLNGCKYDSRTSEKIGFVPQNDQLFSTLSVLETLKLHVTLRATADGPTEDAQFEALLRTLDLQDCMHIRIGEPGVTTGRRKGVSGGERKRIAIAL